MKVLIEKLAAPGDRAAGADRQAVHDDQGGPRIDESSFEFHDCIAPNVEPAALTDRKGPFESDLAVDSQQGSIVTVDESDIHEADLHQTCCAHVFESVDADLAAGEEILAPQSEYRVPHEHRQESRPDGAALGPEFEELS